MPAPPNYVFTIFAFVAFFLCLIKFPMQFRAWNVGTHLLVVWVGLRCLMSGINSIIWSHNTVNWAPVWCDISIKFEIGVSIAIPATILCINRRLYLLASPTTIIPSKADKNRELIIDLVIGIGLPIIVMALTFLVQISRFTILEDYGCSATLSYLPTWVFLVTVTIPPIILELIAGVYGCLSIRAFYKRSKLNEIHNDLNPDRYIRLICFSAVDLLCGIPITVYYLFDNIKELVPFPGLTQEHIDISQIIQVPAVVWRAQTLSELSIELNRWITVFVAFVFFAILGFTKESRNSYRAILQSVVQVFVKITGIKSHHSSDAEGIIFYKSGRQDSTI